MPETDPRVDAYISKAAPFAQPILKHIRALVHETLPGVEETIKWGMPAFDYLGPLFSMAAFKQHCVFGFWKAALMKDADQLKENQEGAMGHGGRIESMKDLPPDKKIQGWLKEAAKLNEAGVKLARTVKEKAPLEVPDYFTKALKQHKAAGSVFEKFSTSQKRDYVEWLTEAKTEATRDKRMATALEWIAEGKIRNWKYQR